MKSKWTCDQDRILKEYYPTRETNRIVDLLLGGKTCKQVNKRAFDLRVFKTKEFIRIQKSRLSTKDRTCKICDEKHYGKGFCRTHFALFKRGTIDQNGAGEYRTPVLWTEEEIDLLETIYPVSTNPVLSKAFPSKTTASIKCYASKRGLKKTKETLDRCHKMKMTSESKIKTSCSLRGINREDFTGFSTTFNQRIRQSDEYAKWRSSVYERDDCICQECGEVGNGNLHAHHLIPLSQLIEEYDRELVPDNFVDPYFYRIDNGVTVCNQCHGELHGNEGLAKVSRNHRI